MAGSFAEARAQILSLRPDALRARAEQLRQFGIDTVLAGSQLAASADEVGAQRGAPFAAYRDRVTPTAAWLRELTGPVNAAASGLDRAGESGDRARMALAQQEQLLATLAASPTTTAAQFEAAQAQALVVLNQAIDAVSQSYEAVAPPAPGRAPVLAAGAGSAGPAVGAGAGTLAAGLSAAGADGTLAELAAAEDAAAGAGAGLGPQAGPFAGFVADPTTGNLIDPATGREVDAGGRFLDPITGEPFGSASPFATRLEGLVGGPAATGLGAGIAGAVPGLGVPAAGVIGPLGSAAPGFAPGGAVGSAAGAGVVPLLPPGAVGAVGPGGVGTGRGGAGRFAGLYGGTVPPSLVGPNPAGRELNQIAARNLEHKAGVAQRYAAIASGQASAQIGFFPPPIAGVGGGGAGAARGARRGGPRAVTEPAGVWGAVPDRGRGDRAGSGSSAADVEDDDVWTGGSAVPAGLLGGG